MWLVDFNYIFECDWLIELSDNKLSDNNFASELVESRNFFNQSQSRKLWFLWLKMKQQQHDIKWKKWEELYHHCYIWKSKQIHTQSGKQKNNSKETTLHGCQWMPLATTCQLYSRTWRNKYSNWLYLSLDLSIYCCKFLPLIHKKYESQEKLVW